MVYRSKQGSREPLPVKHDVAAAQQLDQEIEQLLRDFIPLGMKLMQMRDSRLYTQIDNEETGKPFQTFEEYCVAKRQIAARHARRTIQGSLVAQALSSTSRTKKVPQVGGDPILPTRENQARLLTEAVAEFDYEVRDLGGRGDKVPVAVANPEELQKVWQGVAEKYAAAWKKAKDKKPKLTVTFITKALPNQYRRRLPNPLVSRGKVGKTGIAVKAAGRLTDAIHKSGLDDLDTLRELATKEQWSRDDLEDVRDAFKEADNAIAHARDALGRLRL